MGVKDLWNIVSPSCERKPLFDLHGKTIAIDLSGWVVDSQTVTDNVAQPKMYLRNLYFRTVYLLMQGISPVFVLEGKAPDLKHKEIARRIKIRMGDEGKKSAKKGGRSRLNTILKECETMLGLMGVRCVKGSGEAEAMCAYLNADGLVDGCISQDSDCFLYGARTVYRNFCISTQGNRGSSGGLVDEYSMEKIERLFKLGRNKMIVLALLCGCDYSDGISGVGKEAALKLFKIVDDEEILARIKSWSKDPEFERTELKLRDPNVCTSCGHNGKLRSHVKLGCRDCGTVTKCNESYKETRALIANELMLRKKALASEGFPNLELIDEFLVRKDRMPSKLDLEWRQPKIVEFVKFMERHVCWETEYAFAKIFSLTTRWQLRHFAHVPAQDRVLMYGTMIPEGIRKIRNLKGVASYEIVWNDKDGVLEGLTLGKTSDAENDIDNDNENDKCELVSIEPQDAFRKCYPELAEIFENARLAKRTKKPSKNRKKKVPLSVINVNEPEITRKKRRARKKIAEDENRKIDEFVKITLEESFEAMTIAKKRSKPTNEMEKFEKPIAAATPKRKGPQFDKVMASSGLSSKLNDTLDKMFDELTPDDFPSDMENESFEIAQIIDKVCGKKTSEKIVSRKTSGCHDDDDDDDDDTKNYVSSNLENESLAVNEFEIVGAHEISDEFDVSYVPLSERVKLSKRTDPSGDGRSKNLSLGIDDLMNDSDF